MAPSGGPMHPGFPGQGPPLGSWMPAPFPNAGPTPPPGHFPMPPPGQPFMLPPPFGDYKQTIAMPPQHFMPLGSVPPPPPPPLAASSQQPTLQQPSGPAFGSTAYRDGSNNKPSPPNSSRIRSAAGPGGHQGGRNQYTPRPRKSTGHGGHGHSTSRGRSSSYVPPRGLNDIQPGTSPSSPHSSSSASNNGHPGRLQPSSRTSSGFGSSSFKTNSHHSPAPSSRPQSGSSSRSLKRISSANGRKSWSSRPLSAAASFPSASSSVLSSSSLDDSDNIKVAVRVRPLNETELSRGDLPVLEITREDSRQVTLTIPHNAATAPVNSAWMNPVNGAPPTTRHFQFHSCIGPEANQDDVGRLCGITQLLDAALDGYHATILAYGQTGSGKTYTISGRDDDNPSNSLSSILHSGVAEDDGVVSRSLAYIFSQVEARNAALDASMSAAVTAGTSGGDTPATSAALGSEEPAAAGTSSPVAPFTTVLSDGCKYSVRASYSEIYNEALFDLLCFDQRQLSLRWDPVRGFHAPDLTLQECRTLSEAQEVVSSGLRHRRVGSHALNLESSRSHAILTVHIDAVPVLPEAADYGNTRMGKVVFVDLAGSERLKDSLSEGNALRETASINRSLFMLGKVISALASGAKGAMVPYRESKLTKLLMDSLGGSALTLIIACCSPSIAHLEETLSTLSYASRAKNIKNAPVVQMDPHQAAMASLRRAVKILRQENAFLREQLMLAGGGARADGAAIGGTAAVPALPSPPGTGAPSSPGGSPTSVPSLAAQSVMVPVPMPAQEELARRLADAQRLLGTMSLENTRLAAENERLRTGGMQVAGEYSGAVEEIDWLRAKLARLEASLMGAVAVEAVDASDGNLARKEASLQDDGHLLDPPLFYRGNETVEKNNEGVESVIFSPEKLNSGAAAGEEAAQLQEKGQQLALSEPISAHENPQNASQNTSAEPNSNGVSPTWEKNALEGQKKGSPAVQMFARARVTSLPAGPSVDEGEADLKEEVNKNSNEVKISSLPEAAKESNFAAEEEEQSGVVVMSVSRRTSSEGIQLPHEKQMRRKVAQIWTYTEDTDDD